MNREIVLGMALALAAVVSAGAEEAAKSAAPAPTDASRAFAAKCASCHGKDGKGNAALAKVFKASPSALDLTAKTTQDKKDEELNAITAKGKGKMPAFAGKLSDKDIAGLTAHLRTLAKPAAKTEPAAPAKETK